MLWFVGLGISGLEGASTSTIQVLKKADMTFFEVFTSPISKQEISKIKKLVKGKLTIAPRWMVEDGKVILELAKKKNVVLLAYGDPYVATTHLELRTRAEQDKIKTRTIHAASAITSLIGECGLHHYKIGRPVTIMRELPSLATVYYTIYENMVKGSHSLLILEFDNSSNFFLDPRDAISNLLETEKGQKRNVIDQSTFAIVASRIGSKSQKIISGKLGTLVKTDFGKPPHTIIIPGRLHFTEHDAIKIFSTCLDEPFDNSSKIVKISDQMLSRYIPKARGALEEVVKMFKDDKTLSPVIENAQLYIDDAEKFQKEGKEELAVLSIGYAEGLIDALRLSRGIDPWAQSL
ncbi:Diphthine synthase [Nitrosotalea sinensis]|uniref:Diphthine synthase n=1 Tax=Nitrosotalea sinensis TaxID=1499975 RepID=A0A2H1EH37_9ARCH|nr:diphthine synthase [Candidatus Nitrosotalea sinensis]SHO45257.1 Diphthine synthase [Candidatus Nitrosotalea sinensis]